jgi:GH18 family chitinase
LDELIAAGVPSRKLFMGIPAYGRHEREVGRVMSFAEIVDAAGTQEPETVQGYWNDFKYDTTTIVRRKVQLAREKNLGGVFMWEVGQDKQTDDNTGGLLLETLANEVAIARIGSSEL